MAKKDTKAPVKTTTAGDSAANAAELQAKKEAETKAKIEAKEAENAKKAAAKAEKEAARAKAKAEKEAQKAEKAKQAEAQKAEREKAKVEAAKAREAATAKLNEAKEALKAAREAARAAGTSGSTKGPGALRAYASQYVHDSAHKTAGGNPSIHCNDDIAQKLAGKTLDEVYAMTAKIVEVPVAELKAKYGHLNLGMQRMNLGNRIRGVAHAK